MVQHSGVAWEVLDGSCPNPLQHGCRRLAEPYRLVRTLEHTPLVVHELMVGKLDSDLGRTLEPSGSRKLTSNESSATRSSGA